MAKLPSMKTDSPFFNFMRKLGDVVLLNVTWIVCCLPVATIGASTTALFYAARKIAAGEDHRIWRDFFHSFRANWKQATALWLILLAWLAEEGFAFPLLARYDYRLGRLVLDALRLTVKKGYIAVVHILLVIWLPALLFIDPNLFLFCLPLWLLAGGAASAVAVSGLLLPVQKEIEEG